jgi:putative phage-type endonuclease
MTGVLIPTATEAEWLEARRQGVTASEIAVIMGLSPWSSPYALFWRKLGELPEQDDSEAMALGRYLEAYVCDRFAERHDEFALDQQARWSLFAHPDRPWQLATPDRVVNDVRFDMLDGVSDVFEEYEPYAVLEAKTDASYEGWGEDGTDEIPVQYRAQVLWQCDVLGVGHWYLACLFLHSRKLRVYEGSIDAEAEADLKIMRDTAQCFLDDIRDGRPPDVDWRPATTAALKRLHPSLSDSAAVIPARLAARYRAACKAVQAAERRKKLAENQIRDRIGASRYAMAGGGAGTPRDLVATRQVYDVKEHTRKASTVDKLTPAKTKETP